MRTQEGDDSKEKDVGPYNSKSDGGCRVFKQGYKGKLERQKVPFIKVDCLK